MGRFSVFLVSKTVVVCLVALSLLMTAFSHRPALSVDDLAQADYLASFGLTSDALCGVPGADGGGMDMGDCPACQLAGAMMMPEQAQSLIDIDLRFAAVVLVAAKARSPGHTANPATPVRAPPLA